MAAQNVRGVVAVVDDAVTVSCVDCGGAGIQLVGSEDFDGTVTFEASLGDDVWVAISATPVGTVTPVTTATDDGTFQLAIAGMNQIRARLSTATAGSMIATIQTCISSVTKY